MREEKKLGAVQALGGAVSVAGGVCVVVAVTGGLMTIGCDVYRFVKLSDVLFGLRILRLNHATSSDFTLFTIAQAKRSADLDGVRADAREQQIMLATAEIQRATIARGGLKVFQRAKTCEMEQRSKTAAEGVPLVAIPVAPDTPPANAAAGAPVGAGEPDEKLEGGGYFGHGDVNRFPPLVLECQRYWWHTWGDRPKGWRHELLESERSTMYWPPEQERPKLPQSDSGLSTCRRAITPHIRDGETDADGWRYAVNNCRIHDWYSQPKHMSYVRTREWQHEWRGHKS